MILRRALAIAAAIGAVLAGAGVTIVAASYALYALMTAYLPRAGAAAVVAGVFAVIVVIVALVAVRAASPKKPKVSEQPKSMVDRAIDLARDKPLLAAGGALAAGLIALRNPALLAALVGLAGQAPVKTKR